MLVVIVTEEYQSEVVSAQQDECLTAEQEVAGSISGAGPILRVLKKLINKGTAFASMSKCRGSRLAGKGRGCGCG